MSRLLLSTTLLLVILSLISTSHASQNTTEIASSRKVPCIFVPEATVRTVLHSHMEPYSKQLADCAKATKQIHSKVIASEKKIKGITDEIARIEALLKTVQEKVHEKHDEKEKAILNLKDLLEKLRKPLQNAQAERKALEEEHKKSTESCAQVHKQTQSYENALKNVDTAESNMAYAEKTIRTLRASKKDSRTKIKELKALIAAHTEKISSHEKELKTHTSNHAACSKARSEHVEFTQKLAKCEDELRPVKTEFSVCDSSRKHVVSENDKLNAAIAKLEKEAEKLAGEESKWKNLAEQYRPKTVEEQEKENEPEENTKYTGGHNVCHSTGDPHYVALNADNNVRKTAFDVYKEEGDFLLFRSPDNEFEVHTRLGFTKQWGTYSCNRAVAVRADGNVIEAYGGDDFKINGKREIIPAGKTLTLKNGVTVTCSQRNAKLQTYRISEPDGGIVIFNAILLNEGVYYFNVALHSPTAWSKIAKGLCVFPVRSKAKIDALRLDNKPGHHLFGTAYVTENDHHAVSKVEWANAKLKADAEHFCHKILQRKEEFYNDCLLDAKIAGTIDVLKGYEPQAENIDMLMKIEGDLETSALGRGYHILARVLRALNHTQKDMEDAKVLQLLASSGHTGYKEKVAEILARLDREIDTVRAVNAELGKRLTA